MEAVWGLAGQTTGIKGTVSVFSSNPPCNDGNARFTVAPTKASTDQLRIRC